MHRRKVLKTGLGIAAMAGISQPVMSLAGRVLPKPITRKIYLFSKHLHWVGYDEMSSMVSDLGYDGIDLTVRPKGHVQPQHVVRDLPRAVEAADKQGLEVKMITTAITDASEQHTENILSTASNLGIKFYRLGWFKYDLSISISENIRQFSIAMAKIAELNARYNLIADYQNHAGTSAGSPVWDVHEILKLANSPYLGVQYDIRHAMVEGMNSWPLGLRLLAPHIHTLDIKDFEWTKQDGKWMVQNVPLGQGAVDFRVFFKLLNELAIAAPISIHFEYPLGGADHGNTQISIPGSQVLKAMADDLSYIKSVM